MDINVVAQAIIREKSKRRFAYTWGKLADVHDATVSLRNLLRTLEKLGIRSAED
jgi:hypothetical protein